MIEKGPKHAEHDILIAKVHPIIFWHYYAKHRFIQYLKHQGKYVLLSFFIINHQFIMRNKYTENSINYLER